MKGFSVIEVLLAAAMFMIFSVATGTVVLQGFSGNRLGEEQTIASQYATEGLEAARSVKNQAFSNLVNSAGVGIVQSGGVWTFSGANNQFGPSNKYTRVLSVTDVLRDGSGNIVASGGTLDPDTKKITSTVSWNFGPSRPDSVVLTTYLTDFRKSILAGGLLVYGDGTTTPKYRTYDPGTNTFSAELSSLVGSAGRSFILRTSPVKGEAIAGYITAGGVLQVMCYDGSGWVNEWSVTVGGTGTTRRFDISYETNSGDAMVLYSTNTATTNELAYRTKAGSVGCGVANWASATNLNPIRTSGVVQWVKMAWDRRASSNLITAIWADANSDLSAMVWSGSGWGNEPSATIETSLEVVTAAQDVEDFDVDYESLSGDVMVVWANSAGANGTNGVRYRTCTGGTSACTWNAVTTPPTFADDATNLDISANPDTDQIAFASIGNAGSDLQKGYWSGSAWTDTANVDITAATPLAGTKLVSTGWLISGATTRSIIVYNDSGATNIGWYACNASACGAAQADFAASPIFANPQKYYELQMNPLSKDQLIFTLTDNLNDLYSKRLVMTAVPAFTWTNSDGAALETTLPQSINSPFSFAFWRSQ